MGSIFHPSIDHPFIYHAETPLGPVTLASDGEALTGLWFDGQKHFGSSLGEAVAGHAVATDAAAVIDPDAAAGASGSVEAAPPVIRETLRWLELYFRGEDPGFTPALSFDAPGATPFRKAVWEMLLTIPYGHTVTYGELARRLETRPEFARSGRRVSARAVGGAVARNPISLIVPCHRVVGADGSLTGYAGGTERKRRLLELEQGYMIYCNKISRNN